MNLPPLDPTTASPAALIALVVVWAAMLFIPLRMAWTVSRLSRRAQGADGDTANDAPPLTVVVTARGEAESLGHLLPTLLNQSYACYEVVVALFDEADDFDEAEHLLRRLQLIHPDLSHTALPRGTRHPDPERLALLLGVRAARHAHIVHLRAHCRVSGPHWLATIGRAVARHPEKAVWEGHADDGCGGVTHRAFLRMDFLSAGRCTGPVGILLHPDSFVRRERNGRKKD